MSLERTVRCIADRRTFWTTEKGKFWTTVCWWVLRRWRVTKLISLTNGKMEVFWECAIFSSLVKIKKNYSKILCALWSQEREYNKLFLVLDIVTTFLDQIIPLQIKKKKEKFKNIFYVREKWISFLTIFFWNFVQQYSVTIPSTSTLREPFGPHPDLWHVQPTLQPVEFPLHLQVLLEYEYLLSKYLMLLHGSPMIQFKLLVQYHWNKLNNFMLCFFLLVSKQVCYHTLLN